MREAAKKLKLIGYEHWFYPVCDFVYDESYMNKYKGYADSLIGYDINKFRVDITRKYKQNNWGVLDIGIGCGTFMNSFEDGYGYDVNPSAVDYLKQNNRFIDPYKEDISKFSTITFFDSLEHIEHPEEILHRITSNTFIVVSLPTFRDKQHIIESKHFRPDEHYHYFTKDGFIQFMFDNYYGNWEINNGEIGAGREDIVTYVFEKA